MSYFRNIKSPLLSRHKYNNSYESVEYSHGNNIYSQYFRSSDNGRIIDTFFSKQITHNIPYITNTINELKNENELHKTGKLQKYLKNINKRQKFHKSGIIRETKNYTLFENKNWSELNKKSIIEKKFENYPKIKEEVKKVINNKKNIGQEPNYIRKKDHLKKVKSNLDKKNNFREIEDNIIYEGDYNNNGIRKNKKIIKTMEIRTSNINNYDINKFNKSANMNGAEYITTTKKRVQKKCLEVDLN